MFLKISQNSQQNSFDGGYGGGTESFWSFTETQVYQNLNMKIPFQRLVTPKSHTNLNKPAVFSFCGATGVKRSRGGRRTFVLKWLTLSRKFMISRNSTKILFSRNSTKIIFRLFLVTYMALMWSQCIVIRRQINEEIYLKITKYLAEHRNIIHVCELYFDELRNGFHFMMT